MPLTDAQLRAEILATIVNGAYAVKICRNCHFVWTSPLGSVDTAEIIERCDRCLSVKDYVTLEQRVALLEQQVASLLWIPGN